MNPIGLMLVLLAPALMDDQFNCPQIAGKVIVDQQAMNRATPMHLDRLAPSPWVIDYACAVDANGRMTRCRFASRQALTPAQKQLMLRIMPRMMAAVSTDVPNQRCVAGKMTFAVPPAPSSGE
ncbi:hypothetical protein FHS52_001623 [Erythromicrobium ramosum]|uniref:TonB C-terminal domain-containing protein n=1 Tax=Erythrobacter ramosus TaxID=35811 RepID=A0A6I4UNZ1_9SPHN|nr:hypothetical protein [Erythrobacter ramosus]MBB3775654.1 hypothetical protein [Erythrobacter ramosus]MXP39247.1 hypothetical protein [Erythrobacter ramosus]